MDLDAYKVVFGRFITDANEELSGPDNFKLLAHIDEVVTETLAEIEKLKCEKSSKK